MKYISFLFLSILITAHSFGQSNNNEDLNLRITGLAQEFSQKNTEFYIIERDLPGMVALRKGEDSCQVKTSVTIVAIPIKNSDSFRFVEFNACGRQKDKILTLSSMKYFKDYRDEILKDDFNQRHFIDHTEFYSFYEFKNKNLLFKREFFCKECLDTDDKKLNRSNSSLKTYIFFTMLDKELDL